MLRAHLHQSVRGPSFFLDQAAARCKLAELGINPEQGLTFAELESDYGLWVWYQTRFRKVNPYPDLMDMPVEVWAAFELLDLSFSTTGGTGEG